MTHSPLIAMLRSLCERPSSQIYENRGQRSSLQPSDHDPRTTSRISPSSRALAVSTGVRSGVPGKNQCRRDDSPSNANQVLLIRHELRQSHQCLQPNNQKTEMLQSNEKTSIGSANLFWHRKGESECQNVTRLVASILKIFLCKILKAILGNVAQALVPRSTFY